MAAGKKKPDTQNIERSLRDVAEDQLASLPKHSIDLKGQTPEQITHELQVHQIELEIQAEELKKSKIALEESRDKFLDLYDFAPNGYLTLSDRGLIVEVNLTGATLLGVERSRLLKTRFGKYIVEKDADVWHWYFINVLNQDEKKSCTLMLKRAGGSAFPVQLEGRRFISIDRTITVRIAISDITDIKITEDSLLNTNEYLNNLFDHANAPIIVWDPEFRITRFNHAFENLTLRYEMEVVGQRLDILFPEESKDRSLLEIQKTIEGEQWVTVEIPILVRDGSVRTVLWNSANIVNPDGRIISTIAQGIDITERKQVEEALAKSEERFRNVIEATGEYVFEIDANGVATFLSDRVKDILGYEPQEMIGKTPFDFMPSSEEVAKMSVIFGEYSRNKLPIHHMEHKCLSKDGRELILKVTARPILDAAGEIKCYQGTVKDITEHRRAEEALRESEELLQNIIEKNPMSIQILDTDGFTLKVNHAFTMLFGSIPPSDFSIFTDLKNKQPELEKYFLLVKSGDVVNLPEIYFNAHDSLPDYPDVPVWVRAIIFPLKDKDGKPERFVFMHEDITERKRAEDALRESEERYRKLVELSYDGVWLLDKEFLTVYVNPAIEKILGYSKEEMNGRSWYDFGDPEWVARTRELEKNRKEGIEEPNEFLFIHKDGAKILARIATTPLYNKDGIFDGAIGILSDITLQKQTEAALLRVNQKLNVLTHLTRTELTSQIFVLNGYVTMAKIYSAGQDRVIGALEKGERAIMSINGTIASSKDYQDMGVKPPLWQNVKKTMLFGLSHLSIGKIQHSLETGNLEIFADPLLEKAFQHLAGNSFVHGEHVTRIRLWHTITPDGINLIFEDDGIGILQENKKQIFLRSEDTTTSVRDLFFVHDILEITGITISETGEPGKGARFEMMVPNGIWRLSGSGT